MNDQFTNPNIHPVEYLGLFFRWKYDQVVEKNEKQALKEFIHLNRTRFLDAVIGAVSLGVISLIIACLIIFVRYLI